MTLEEIIRKRLEEANITEDKKIVAKETMSKKVMPMETEIDVAPTKKNCTKESLDEMSQEDFDKIDLNELDEESKAILTSYVGKTKTIVEDKVEVKAEIKKTVSEQVSALLEVEGLSEEFKTSAITIFEAAVTDRVLQIEEGLKTEFDSQLATTKAELDNDIDGFLSEAIQGWKQDNQVVIKANFKSQLHESFMDGLSKLIAEHNIDVPTDKEDALATAVGEVDKLNESIKEKEAEMLALVEQVNVLKAEKILESFKLKMTNTEFDRFKQLTESVNFETETQYEKQLSVVQENFGSDKNKKSVVVTPINEVVFDKNTFVSETNSDVAAYASYINGSAKR
jgi:hypothetical protein